MSKNILYVLTGIVLAIGLYFLISPYERCLRSYSEAPVPEALCSAMLSGVY